MHRTRLAAITVFSLAATALAGCGDHGFLGTNYQPTGGIKVVNATTDAVITTTASSPYKADGGGFQVGLLETNFSGPYTVTITGWNNGTNEPCFAASAVTATGSPAIELFNAVNASNSSPNPCVTGGTDVETALITDGKGDTANFFFTEVGTAPATSSAARATAR